MIICKRDKCVHEKHNSGALVKGPKTKLLCFSFEMSWFLISGTMIVGMMCPCCRVKLTFAN